MITVIERLFKRLAATYGARWDASHGITPLNDVKTVWAHELDQFKPSLHRIAWALENLPDRCPNVIEFKNLCRQAPAPESVALPEPKADPARVAAELAKLAPLRVAVDRSHGMREWAHILKTRHESGEKVNANQIRCYQAALGLVAEAA